MENKFQRSFLIFSQEDRGFGNVKEPSGYIKIEVKDNKGRISVSVQNLKEGPDLVYKVYIIKSSEKSFVPVCIGTLAIEKNRGDFNYDFDPSNVKMSGLPVQDFNIAAVLLEVKGKENREIICPLAAYKDRKVSWREQVKEVLLRKEQEVKAKEIKKVNEVSNQTAGKPQSKVPDAGTIKEKSPEELQEQTPIKADSDNAELINKEVPATKEEVAKNENTPPAAGEIASKEEKGEKEEPLPNLGDEQVGMETGMQDQQTESQEIGTKEIENTENIENENPDTKEQESKNQENEIVKISSENDFNKFETYLNYQTQSMNENMVNTFENTVQNCNFQCNNGELPDSLNGCSKCEQYYTKSQSSGMERDGSTLKDHFNSNFEQCKPFRSNRRDYSWWRVKNLIYLNTILYKFNIRIPILYNPGILMAHFKYKHLLIGVYKDLAKRKEYVVFGIPAVFNVDEKPLGGIGRWVQMDGGTPKFGDFGYWLLYVETKTGKLLNLS
ncbi:MAG: hypothetical protein N2645_00100 [Clostridia bacterium]|nr:hypothetical protein [Clostridia bacterium]